MLEEILSLLLIVCKGNFASDLIFLMSLFRLKATSNSFIPLLIICLIIFSFDLFLQRREFSENFFKKFYGYLVAVYNIRGDLAFVSQLIR